MIPYNLWGPQRAQLLIDFQNSQIRPGIDCVSFLGSFHAYFSARGQIQSQHALSCAQPNPPKWGVQVGWAAAGGEQCAVEPSSGSQITNQFPLGTESARDSRPPSGGWPGAVRPRPPEWPGPAGSREMNRSAGSNQGLWPTDWARAGLETTPERSCGTMGGRGTGHFAGVYIVLYSGPREFCYYPTPSLCCPQRPGGRPVVLEGPVGTLSRAPSAPGPRRDRPSQGVLHAQRLAIFY